MTRVWRLESGVCAGVPVLAAAACAEHCENGVRRVGMLMLLLRWGDSIIMSIIVGDIPLHNCK